MDLEDALSLPDGFSGIVRLFPLPNFVLFPGSIQPLHIFEQRYRDLLEDALAGDQLIAMAMLRPGWESDYEGRPPIENIAALGRVIAHTRLDDGRYNILLLGMHRVSIRRELPEHRSFRTAQVELLADQYPNSSGATRKELRHRVLQEVEKHLPETTVNREKLAEVISGKISLGLLTDILAATIEFDVEFKHKLLAEQNVEHRCGMLLERLTAMEPAKDPETQRFRFPIDFSDN